MDALLNEHFYSLLGGYLRRRVSTLLEGDEAKVNEALLEWVKLHLIEKDHKQAEKLLNEDREKFDQLAARMIDTSTDVLAAFLSMIETSYKNWKASGSPSQPPPWWSYLGKDQNSGQNP